MINLSDNNHIKSDISLIAPYCCKWRLVGTDHRGMPMRVMYPLCNNTNEISSIISGDSYFIPDPSSSYIGYPTITTEMLNNNTTLSSYDMYKYVGNLLVRDDYPTYRNYVINNNGRLDDMLYGEKSKNNKWSKTYLYGNNSLEFISGGIKIRITSNDKSIINLSKYNNYSIALICMTGSNPINEKPCEIIIDETQEQIIYIIYNGINASLMTYDTDSSIYQIGRASCRERV